MMMMSLRRVLCHKAGPADFYATRDECGDFLLPSKVTMQSDFNPHCPPIAKPGQLGRADWVTGKLGHGQIGPGTFMTCTSNENKKVPDSNLHA